VNVLLFSPNSVGLIGALFSILFVIIFTTLGCIQKDYNQGRHTVSELVYGKYGWIQNINFIILAFALMFTGYGLGISVHNKVHNPITVSFAIFSLAVLIAAIFPADKIPKNTAYKFKEPSLSEKIHYATFFLILLLTPFILSFTIKGISEVSYLKSLVPYTVFVLISNFASLLIWFYFYVKEIVFNGKGLFQKIIIINAIVWLIVVGLKL
jgi:uncharacterized protein DUF998